MKKSMSPKTHGKILIYIYILQVESDNFGKIEEEIIKQNKNHSYEWFKMVPWARLELARSY